MNYTPLEIMLKETAERKMVSMFLGSIILTVVFMLGAYFLL